MRLFLDTSAYSAFLRGHQDIKQELQRADAIHINPIVLGELHAGFQRGKHRKRNEAILQEFLGSPRTRVVPVDEETAERYAVIVNALRAAGTPIPTNDIWIAASAMQYGLIVVTTDGHYQKVPHVLVRYFSSM